MSKSRTLFKPVRARRGEILAAVRRARRDGSAEVVGENLAIAVVQMTPEVILDLMGSLPAADGVEVIDFIEAAEKSLDARHGIARSALARLAMVAQQEPGGAL